MNPVLFTERLVLRLPEASDLDDWADFSADPETMRYLGGAKGRFDAWRAMCIMRGAWDVGGVGMFSVVERATGNWIGRVGPWQPEAWPGREVGWGIARGYGGKGYGFEAASACMDFVFDVLGWDDVIHTIDPENGRSIALAKRLGSTNLGSTRLPPPLDTRNVDAWGQTAAEWRTRGR